MRAEGRRSAAGSCYRPDLQVYAGRTLDFINIIEKTLQGIDSEKRQLGLMVTEAEAMLSQLRAQPPAETIDPNGRVVDLLRKAAAAIERIYQHWIGCRDSARDDKNLKDDDGVVEAFEDVVGLTADLHNTLFEIIEAVEIHDARAEPASVKAYSNVEDMMADVLGSR